MTDITYDGHPLKAAPAADDYIPIWDVSGNAAKKALRSALVGAVLTGGGTIATNGKTLTVPESGTVAVATPPQTWTPGIAFGGATTGIAYAAQIGFYTRIGNLIYAECDLRLSSKGSATGSATITGLPAAAAGNRGIAWVRWTNMAAPFISIYVLTGVGSTDLSIVGMAAAAASYSGLLTNTHFGETSILLFNLIYLAL